MSQDMWSMQGHKRKHQSIHCGAVHEHRWIQQRCRYAYMCLCMHACIYVVTTTNTKFTTSNMILNLFSSRSGKQTARLTHSPTRSLTHSLARSCTQLHTRSLTHILIQKVKTLHTCNQTVNLPRLKQCYFQIKDTTTRTTTYLPLPLLLQNLPYVCTHIYIARYLGMYV